MRERESKRERERERERETKGGKREESYKDGKRNREKIRGGGGGDREGDSLHPHTDCQWRSFRPGLHNTWIRGMCILNFSSFMRTVSATRLGPGMSPNCLASLRIDSSKELCSFSTTSALSTTKGPMIQNKSRKFA